MRALLPSRHLPIPSSLDALRAQPNTIQELLKPSLDLSENSDHLVAGSVGELLAGGDLFQIPRFIFIGPDGGGDSIRIGVFAAIHGDELEGVEAVLKFLEELESKPRIAKGYHLYIYPICNPTGFVARTSNNGSGEDLAKHFWRGSSQPEIYYLERELGVLRFQGVIPIHVKNHSNTFVLRTNSEVLNRDVVHPVVQATQRLLSINFSKAEPGEDLPSDFLTAGDELAPIPFELHISVPRNVPVLSRINGTVNLLNSILETYRSLLSIGQNI